MKKYCFACGSKLEFSLKEKPKFCSKCGTSLGGETVSTVDSNEEDDGEEQILTIPNIDKLDFVFEENPLQGKPPKLGEIMGTLEEGQVGKFPRPQSQGAQEDAMEEFRKEAGTLKKDTSKDAQT